MGGYNRMEPGRSFAEIPIDMDLAFLAVWGILELVHPVRYVLAVPVGYGPRAFF